MRYAGDPYRCYARFSSTCPDCLSSIKKGEEITIWPRSRKGERARHWKCSETDYNRFVEAAFIEDNNLNRSL